MDIAVRPLRAGDAAAVAAIHSEACRIAYRFMNWDHALADVEHWIETERMSAWDWGLVAEGGGAPVAYAAMTGAHLDHLFVTPAAQGQGIGAMLLMRALDRGLLPLTLNVFEDNVPARRFYERHGFGERERWFNEWDGAVELRYALAGQNAAFTP